MTAVANPPSFQQLNRSAWNISSGQNPNSMNSDDVRGMFMPRKSMQRSNSSSSISSTSSASSTTTVASNSSQSNGSAASTSSDISTWSNAAARKRPQPKVPWPPGKSDATADAGRMPPGRGTINGMNGINGGPLPSAQGQAQAMSQQQMGGRPMGEPMGPGQPVLYLLSLNGTFERKTISVPLYPDSLRIGRQTNQKTVPTPANGFFDSKVLSRQHAEVWGDRTGKIYIRDVKSSNGTFVNGTRLSQENRESEPHELQTGDHLELGIDIVSEDQKTVVHHKVAAKVEHAGFVSPSSNVLEMNFGDLDPANGGAMLGPPQPGLPLRSRQGSNTSLAASGRGMPAPLPGAQMNGAAGRGSFLLATVTSEHIIKRLHSEMRNARLQSQDLGRTGQFINTMLSKHDIKDADKPEVPEPPKPLVNGNALPFRPDPKTRFSDPPAPPPQQPLPEKPDVPSLKRTSTERPKSQTSASPVRPDNVSQIMQLTEALNDAKREIDSQTVRMRDLEEMLQKEREARELAEDLARRLEDTAVPQEMNGAPKGSSDSILEEAFEPPRECTESADVEMPDAHEMEQEAPSSVDDVEAVATHFQSKIDSMVSEMMELRQQMEAWRTRCEKAEAERDTDRETLEEMILKIRKDEEARLIAARDNSHSRSTSRRGRSRTKASNQDPNPTRDEDCAKPEPTTPAVMEQLSDKPTLSRANTITPATASATALTQHQTLVEGVPYASMLGVVLIGMGLMAYMNGWQPPRPDQ